MSGYTFKPSKQKKNFLYLRRIYIHYICIRMFSIVVDCVWGDWVEGDCSTTCGAGQQNMTRVKLVEEAHGGACNGELINVTSCLVVECPGKYLSLSLGKQTLPIISCIITIIFSDLQQK